MCWLFKIQFKGERIDWSNNDQFLDLMNYFLMDKDNSKLKNLSLI